MRLDIASETSSAFFTVRIAEFSRFDTFLKVKSITANASIRSTMSRESLTMATISAKSEKVN